MLPPKMYVGLTSAGPPCMITRWQFIAEITVVGVPINVGMGLDQCSANELRVINIIIGFRFLQKKSTTLNTHMQSPVVIAMGATFGSF